jgi:hypothetical protein
VGILWRLDKQRKKKKKKKKTHTVSVIRPSTTFLNVYELLVWALFFLA